MNRHVIISSVVIRGSLAAAAVAIPVVLMFLIGFTPGISMIEDLGRHLLMGRKILETGIVPTTNLLTYTCPDFPAVDHHWFFQCAAAVLHQHIGLNGMILVKALLLAVALAVALWAARRTIGRGADSDPFLPITVLWFSGVLSAVVIGYRGHIRPELFSFLFVATLLLLFELERGGARERWRLAFRILGVAVMLVWVNTHIYFIFGLGMLAAFALERCLVQPSWRRVGVECAWLLGATAACACNPVGVRGVAYPFAIFTNYGVDIIENRPPWILWKNAVNPMLLALPPLSLMTLVALAWIGVWLSTHFRKNENGEGNAICSALVKVRPANCVIAVAALAAAWVMARNTPLLALGAPAVIAAAAALPARAPGGTGGIRRGAAIGIAALSLLLSVLIGWAVLDGAYSRVFSAPNAPTSFGLDYPERYERLRGLMSRFDLKGPVFSDFNIGSLVEYNLHPQPGYVDNRPEAFPLSFWKEEYLPAMDSPERWHGLAADRNFNIVVLSLWLERLPLSFRREDNPDWALVHVDDFMAVWLRRTTANAPAIAEREVTPERLRLEARGVSLDLLALPDTPWWRRQILAESVLFRLYGIVRAGGPEFALPYIELFLRRYPGHRMGLEVLRAVQLNSKSEDRNPKEEQ